MAAVIPNGATGDVTINSQRITFEESPLKVSCRRARSSPVRRNTRCRRVRPRGFNTAGSRSS